jgi:2,3-bisphosphoglycerate-dependent phosphoglycerate mutase
MDTVARMFEYGNKKYPTFCHLDGGKMQKWGEYKYSGENDVKIFVSEKLNERYYGKLQGINKDIAMQEYGKEKVHLWRRSYTIAPPGGESLKDVVKRVVPFYKKYIERDLKKGDNVLVVASHNSLRGIIKYVGKISDKEIINLEIPYAGLSIYEFDEMLKVKNKTVV